MKVFPTYHFSPNGVEADIERRTISGGTSLSGEDTLVATDGGGRVFLEISDMYLDDPELALAVRAINTVSDGGTLPFIVPLCDARHQMQGDVTLPPGGLPWWEESDFAFAQIDARVTQDAPLRATAIEFAAPYLSGPLRPGVWISIDHPTWRHRAYRIASIEGDTLHIRPPLREAVTEGTPIEVRDPKCVMRIEGDMRTPTTFGYADGAGGRFVEFPGVPA